MEKEPNEIMKVEDQMNQEKMNRATIMSRVIPMVHAQTKQI